MKSANIWGVATNQLPSQKIITTHKLGTTRRKLYQTAFIPSIGLRQIFQGCSFHICILRDHFFILKLINSEKKTKKTQGSEDGCAIFIQPTRLFVFR